MKIGKMGLFCGSGRISQQTEGVGMYVEDVIFKESLRSFFWADTRPWRSQDYCDLSLKVCLLSVVKRA